MSERTLPFLLALLCFAAAQVFAERPNVILIMTDDQGYGELACHGNPVIQTPETDQLYTNSVRLTDFHVSPVCTPTRAALMTGRYPERTGAFRTTSGRSMLHTDEVTIAELFADDGYVTGLVAKWHLGDNAPHRPQDRGFQDVVWHHGGGVGQAPDYWYNDYFDDTYERNGTFLSYTGYCTDVWFDEAIRFVDENQTNEFFLYIAPNAPHSPYLVGSEWSDPYEAGVRWKSGAEFYGMIENVDYNLGRLRDHLDTLAIASNTILIFMTDNGTANGFGGVTETGELLGTNDYTGFRADMRGQKGTLWEGGHRVPFFIHWPDGGLTGGRDLDHLAGHIDVLPTVAELCGVSLSNAPPLDGISFAAQLAAGSTNSASRDHLVVQMTGGAGFSDPEHRNVCVIKDQWRLIKEFNGSNDTVGSNERLYDISLDPSQVANVALSNTGIVQQLNALYQPFWTSVVTRIAPVPIDLGNRIENPTELCCFDWYFPAGNPPWQRGAVDNLIRTNGFWNVDIKEAGRYRVTLRQMPAAVVDEALFAVTAKVAIAGVVMESPVIPGVDKVAFEMLLPAGVTTLQTWLYDENDDVGGAYFTEVSLLDSVVYDETTNWSSKVVTSNSSVFIHNGATVTLDQSDEALSLTVNDDASPTSTLQIAQHVSLTLGGSAGLELGAGTGAGIVNQSSGTVSTVDLTVNASGMGDRSSYNLSGGSVTADSVFVNSAGEINVSGGSLTADQLSVNPGGEVNISGGSVTSAFFTLISNGVVTLTGGELFVDDGEIAEGGLLDINGGTFKPNTAIATTGGLLYFGEGNPGGLIKLRSGSFETTGGKNLRLFMDLHVSGGTINWGADRSISFDDSEFRVIGNGATISSGYYNPGQFDLGGSTYFEMGSNGISTINATVHAQLLHSSITVDGAAYTGGSATFTLIDTPDLVNVSPSVTITNFPAGVMAVVDQNQTTDQVTLTITVDGNQAQRPAKPNFVILLADDLGWQDVKCYDTEPPFSVFETPHMDQLATNGIRFTQGYAPAPSCAPSRVGILSGRHPARVGKTHVLGGECPKPVNQDTFRMMDPYYTARMASEEITIPEALEPYGYFSGHIGKWHVAITFPQPEDQGFDWTRQNTGVWAGMTNRLSDFATTNALDPYQLDENGFAFDQTTEDALDFLSEAVATNQPFFCYYASWLVHTPIQIRTESLLEKYAGKMGYSYPLDGSEIFAEGQNNPFYAAMVETFDYSVHRIVSYLEETDDPRWPGHKLIENTYIFLTSDNGGWEGVNRNITDNYPLDRGKIRAEEGGTRVPFVVVGPDIPTNVVSDVMVNGLDFYPTMLSLAGIPVPDHLDGSDISPLLLQDPQDAQGVTNSAGDVRDTMYWHFPHGSALHSTIRRNGWKLFKNYDHVDNGALEAYRLYKLYDTNNVPNDIEEAVDLVDVETNMAVELAAELDAWLNEAGARLPHYNPKYASTLTNSHSVPAVLDSGHSNGIGWVTFDTNAAAVVHADMIYTLNGDGSRDEEWFRIDAQLDAAGGRAEAVIPDGTTHYLFNLIDQNNFLISSVDVGQSTDDLRDSVAVPSYVPLFVGPHTILYSNDFSSGSSLEEGSLVRDAVGFHKSIVSAWTDVGGMLSNTSLVNTTESEGAVGIILDVSSISNNALDQLTLSFDYSTAEAAEKIHVHLWGYVDVSSSPSSPTMNLAGSNGNALDAQRNLGDLTTYNLGKTNGVFTGNVGNGGDAAVILTASTGVQHYARTFNLAGFTSAPDNLGAYDYLVLGFARSIAGTSPAATIDNVVLSAPAFGTYAMWVFDYGLTEDGTSANPDGDALNNLYEYGLGGDPTNALDIGHVPVVGMTRVGGTNFFQYTYARRIGSEHELDYYLELASNLIAGNWTNSGYTELSSVGSIDADFEAVTNRIDTTVISRQFIRLAIDAL